jgi:hypothetical protein
MIEKPFLIKCPRCKWFERVQGTKDSLKHLLEKKSGCSTCGKKRRFYCPKCSSLATMIRIFGK